MIDRYLRELIAGGASKEQISKMLGNIGYKESEVTTLIEKYGKDIKAPEINVDQRTMAKIASEYLYKHTNEANRATQSTGLPSELRDAIGHLSRSQAIYNNANVLLPRLPLGQINSLRTNDKLFDQLAKQVNSITGYKLPASTVAYNSRAIEQFARELQKIRGLKPKFARGGSLSGYAPGGQTSDPRLPVDIMVDPKAYKAFQDMLMTPKLKGWANTNANVNVGSAGFSANILKNLTKKFNFARDPLGLATRVGRSLSKPSYNTPNLNFMPQRSSHPYGIRDWLKAQKSNIISGALTGAGTAGLMGIAGHIANLAFSGFVPPFASGGSIRHFVMGQPIKGVDKRIYNKLMEQYEGLFSEGPGTSRLIYALQDLQDQKKGSLYGNIVSYGKNYEPMGALSYTDTGKSLWMSNLGVQEKYQGRGIASKLFDTYLQHAQSSGYKSAEWQSLDIPNTIDFYKKRAQLVDRNSLTFRKSFAIGGDTFTTPKIDTSIYKKLMSDATKRLTLKRNQIQAAKRLADLRDNYQIEKQLKNLQLMRSPETSIGVIGKNTEDYLTAFLNQPRFASGGVIDYLRNIHTIKNEESIEKLLGSNALENAVSSHLNEQSLYEKYLFYAPRLGSSTLDWKMKSLGATAEQLDRFNSMQGKVVANRYSKVPFFAKGGYIRVSPHEALTSTWNADLDKLNKAGRDGVVSPDEVRNVNFGKVSGAIKGMFAGTRAQSKDDNITIDANSNKVSGVLNGAATDFVEQSTGGKIPSFALGGPDTSIDDFKRSIRSTQTSDIVEMLTRSIIAETVKKVSGVDKSYSAMFGKQFLSPGANIQQWREPSTRAEISAYELQGMRNRKEPSDVYKPQTISKYDTIETVAEKLSKTMAKLDTSFSDLDKEVIQDYADRVQYRNPYDKIRAQQSQEAAKLLPLITGLEDKIRSAYGDRVPNLRTGTNEKLILDSFSKQRFEDLRKSSESGTVKTALRDALAVFAEKTQFTTQQRQVTFRGAGELEVAGISKRFDQFIQAERAKGVTSNEELYSRIPTELKGELDTYIRNNEMLTGGLERNIQRLMQDMFGKIIGNKEAAKMVTVTSSRDTSANIGFEGPNKQLVQFDVNVEAVVNKLGKLGKSSEFVEGTMRELQSRIRSVTGDKNFTIRATEGITTQESAFGTRQRVGEKLKEFSWKSASLSMSSMGVYFSMLGLFTTLQGVVNSLAGSISDLNKTFQNIGYVNQFGRGILSAKDILSGFGVAQKDLISGWKNVMYVQSAVGLMFSGLAAKMFNNKEFIKTLTVALQDFFSQLSQTDTLQVLEQLMVNLAKAAPAVISALNIMGKGLEFIAANQTMATAAIVAFLASLIVQPIAAFASASLMLVGSMVQISAYSGAATKGVTTFTGALGVGLGTVILYTAAIAALVEVGSRLYDAFTGNNTAFIRPSTYIGKALGFEKGGEVPGQEDNTADNHVVRVDEGEYVINKKAAKKLGKKRLDELNRYQTGGVIGNLPDITPVGFDATKVQVAIKNASSDNLYYVRRQNELVGQNSDYNRSTRDALMDSAAGSRPLYVYDLSPKGLTGTTNQGTQFPFTLNTPALVNLVADNPLKGDTRGDSGVKSDIKDIKGDVKDIKGNTKDTKGSVRDVKDNTRDTKGDIREVKDDTRDSKSDTKDIKDNTKDTKGNTKESVKSTVKTSDVLSKYQESIVKGQIGTAPETTPKTSLGKVAGTVKSVWKGTYNPAGWGMKEVVPSDAGDVMAFGATALQHGPYSSQMVETGLSQAAGGVATAGTLGGLSWVSSKALETQGTSAGAKAARMIGTAGALTETGATGAMNAGLSIPALAVESVVGAGYTWNQYKKGVKPTDLYNLQTGTDMFTGGFPQAAVARGVESIDKIFGTGASQKLVNLQSSTVGKGLDAIADIATTVGSFGAKAGLTNVQTQVSNYLQSAGGQQLTNRINNIPVVGTTITAGLNQASTQLTASDIGLGSASMFAGISDFLDKYKSQGLLSAGLASTNPLVTAVGGAATLGSVNTTEVNNAFKGVTSVVSDAIGSLTGFGAKASASSTDFNNNVGKLANNAARYATIVEQGKGTTKVAIDNYGNILTEGGQTTGKSINNFGNVIDTGSGEIDKNFAVVSTTLFKGSTDLSAAITKATDDVSASLSNAATQWSFASTGGLTNQPSFITGVSKQTIQENKSLGTVTKDNEATGEWSFEGVSTSTDKNTEAINKNTDALSKNSDITDKQVSATDKQTSATQTTETSGKIQYYTDANGNKYGGNNTANDYIFNEQEAKATTTSKIDIPSEYTGSTAIGDWSGFNVKSDNTGVTDAINTGNSAITTSMSDVGSKIESGNQQVASNLANVQSNVSQTSSTMSEVGSKVDSATSEVGTKIDTTNSAVPDAINTSTAATNSTTTAVTEQTAVLNNILTILQLISQYVQTISGNMGTTSISTGTTASTASTNNESSAFFSELSSNYW